jgi:hypothetical protein
MDEIGKLPYSVHGYCATCGKDFGTAKREFLGRRIDCTDPDHLAQVISADGPAGWWLRREEWLLKWQTGRDRRVLCSPFALLRRLQRYLSLKLSKTEPAKPIQAGTFLLAAFGLIALALIAEAIDCAWWVRWTVGLLLLWRFIDIFFSNTSITFTSRLPASPLRSVVFSFLTYVQIVLCYSYFYCVLFDFGAVGPKENNAFSVMESVYFSFGTIATVGYGMVEPKNLLGKLFVASELVLGLYFAVIILAQVAAWTNQSKVELGRFPWNDLKQD